MRLQKIGILLCGVFMFWAVSPSMKPASMSRGLVDIDIEKGLVDWCQTSRTTVKIPAMLLGDDAIKAHRQVVENICANFAHSEPPHAEPTPH